jgi:hypothetical protein
MQIGLCYAGKQEHNCYIVRRDPGGVHGQRVSSGRCAFGSAWSLIVDDLHWGRNSNGYYTVVYADDIAIINGKFFQTASEVLLTALCTVQEWCERTNLSINPNKTVFIPFTRRKNMKGLKEPTLFSKTIQLSSDVMYLGLTLDKEPTWKRSWTTLSTRPRRLSRYAEERLGKHGD